jgi:hypothetical protein
LKQQHRYQSSQAVAKSWFTHMTKRSKTEEAGKKAKSSNEPTAVKSSITSTVDFYRDDLPRTLFPLRTNLFLIENGEADIQAFIEKCLDAEEKAHAFLPQRRVYAAKPSFHLRRTVKLDVVSEYYLYDVVFKNRAKFRKPFSDHRRHFGYRFDSGTPISATSAYRAFKSAIAQYSSEFKHFISLDVASYFNSVYHHDLVNWIRELGVDEDEVNGFGQMLREINSGRSVDCLPQGLYPAKMIGNDFLRFVENYHGIKSDRVIRFMDDIYLFSNSEQTIMNDFTLVQTILGDKGLSINPQKTSRTSAQHVNLEKQIDKAKEDLLRKRRLILEVGYGDQAETKEFLLRTPLTKEEVSYLTQILAQPEIDEEDAELILTMMRENTKKVEARLPDIIQQFPNLSKSVHSFCSGIKDKEALADILVDILEKSARLLEFQLFWFAAILEDHLMSTSKTSALIDLIFNHPSATPITKARVLEIMDARFGLTELRASILSTGQSDWLGWASAVGSRSLKPGSRNHTLKYFGNCSQINHLIATIVMK